MNFKTKYATLLESLRGGFQIGDEVIITNPFESEENLYNRRWLLRNIGQPGKIVDFRSSVRAVITFTNKKGKEQRVNCPIIFLRKKSDIIQTSDNPDTINSTNFTNLINQYVNKFNIYQQRNQNHLFISIRSKHDKGSRNLICYMYFYPLKYIVIASAAYINISDKSNLKFKSISKLKEYLDIALAKDLDNIAPAISTIKSIDDKIEASDLLDI